MNIEDLLLKREELPIVRMKEFLVPIHPKILSDGKDLSREIAYDVLPEVARAFYADLQVLVNTLDQENQEWIRETFLKSEPRIVKDSFEIRMPPINFWNPVALASKTSGFVKSLSMNAAGGALYFNKDDRMCKDVVFSSPYVLFTPEKFLAYGEKGIIEESSIGFSYAKHNVDSLPQALFLRNWAIAYLNAALKQVLKEK